MSKYLYEEYEMLIFMLNCVKIPDLILFTADKLQVTHLLMMIFSSINYINSPHHVPMQSEQLI